MTKTTTETETKFLLVTLVTLVVVTPVTLVTLVTRVTLVTLVTPVILVTLITLVTLVTLFWSPNQFNRAEFISPESEHGGYLLAPSGALIAIPTYY